MVKNFSKVLILFILLANAFTVFAKKIPPTPTGIDRFVQDYAELLSPMQEREIRQQLYNLWDTTSTEIVVVTDNSLEGEDIYSYSFKLARAWGIGSKQDDNGILLYISKEDRKMYIQIGYGLEGALTDGMAGEIIRNDITPLFKDANYALGIHQGVDAIIAAVNGEYNTKRKKSGGGFPPFLIVIIVVIIIIILSSIGDNDGRIYRGRGSSDYDDDWNPTRSRGSRSIFFPPSRSGGGFGGFGGGSFGGGSFGGGGAGGSW